ncbi:SubName: Full=Uncharacterized protein {ECO:0000313/EMBL:CCA75643.1} [Serendipita indica DSM 11827]|nr:SubName: Full=Uncharacterized protein {ECO:0000313/EMBL:CCA75643.1} [Serendipita indica DSM 11827]
MINLGILLICHGSETHDSPSVILSPVSSVVAKRRGTYASVNITTLFLNNYGHAEFLNEQNPQSDSTSVMWNGFRIFNDSKFFSYLNNTHNKEIYAFWKLVLAGHKWELVYAHFHSLYVDVPDEAAQRLKASLQAVEHRIWRDAIETARMYCMETAAQGRMRCIRHHVTNYKYLGEPETWVEQMENSSFEDKVALILSARRFNLDGQVNTMLKEHARAQYQAGSTALSEFNVSEGNHFALKEYQCEPDPIMEPKWDALKDWDAADRRDVGNVLDSL